MDWRALETELRHFPINCRCALPGSHSHKTDAVIASYLAKHQADARRDVDALLRSEGITVREDDDR